MQCWLFIIFLQMSSCCQFLEMGTESGWIFYILLFSKDCYYSQECIPVGCVPSAAVAVWWGWGCLPRGMSAQGGVCLGMYVCQVGGVCPGVCSFFWICPKFYWAPDFVEFVLGRFSHFYIAIAYSNSTFCGSWTPSFSEFTWKLSKFQQNEHTQGGVCPGGVSVWRGVWGGVSAWWVFVCPGRVHLPPFRGQTDSRENITFLQLLLRTVKISRSE